MCVITLKWGDAWPCVWGWDLRAGRKEERRGGGGWRGGDEGGQESKAKRERSSEAKENLVILRTAALLMDTVCVGLRLCVWERLEKGVGGGGGSAGKGCVYPICSLPLPCGRKNHWPALSLIPEDRGWETDTGEGGRERSRPQGVAKEPAKRERVHVSVLTELKNLSCGLWSYMLPENHWFKQAYLKSDTYMPRNIGQIV